MTSGPDSATRRTPSVLPDVEMRGATIDLKHLMIERIIQLRVLGNRATEIARIMTAEGTFGRISWTHVQRLIREAAQDARDRVQDTLNERYMEQDELLEYLRAKVMQRMEALPEGATDAFDKLLRGVLLVADRSAKLHGLDGSPAPGGANKYEWLETAGRAALLKVAEEHGIDVPTKFKV